MSSKASKTNAHKFSGERLKENQKQMDIQTSNILAAKAVADLIRTSLGPRGMDKMIRAPHGENFITNDGATIMEQIKVQHPIAKMLVEVSKAQDAEVGDGTTSVVVIAGALLGAALQLLERGIHPQKISEGYFKAARKAEEILTSMAIPIDLTDRESLIKSAITSLNSKVVSQYSNILAPIAVDAVLKTIDPKTATNVDLKNIHVTKKLGGTVDDTELIEGIVFTQKFSRGDWPSRVTNAKIALIQFHLSPPKTQMDNCIVINDYAKMDRVLREERNYILNLCKTIQKSGCNVLLIQKAILRDATTDLSLQYLAKMKIMVVNWVDRGDMNFVCKALGCVPIPNIESFRAEKFGRADLVEEVSTGEGRVVKITGIPNPGQVVSILCRGSNNLMLDESERSLHDALCVLRSLVKKRFLIAGGAAPEMELAVELERYSKTLAGSDSYCVRAFAEALEIIPYTLAENAGLNPISIVTELRNRHAAGEKNVGINVKKGIISDILQESVIQPLLVSTSAISLATEVAGTILKIDDILMARR